MFATADPKQPFCVANQIEIFPRDEQVLFKLYQPVVGSMAISLYETLIQNFDPYEILSDAKGIYYLQEQMDCGLKQLFTALHRLEAVGLVQTYLTDSKVSQVLVFKLLRVPAAAEFFATPLLASYLKEKMGVTAFNHLSHYFSKQSRLRHKAIKNVRDVSASFFEVFHLPDEEAINPSEEVQKAARANQIHDVSRARINRRDSIDWQFLRQQFAMYQVDPGEVRKNQQQIRSLMQTYGLSEQEFVDEALPSLHGSNHLNLGRIANLLADNYKDDETRRQIKAKLQVGQEKAGPVLHASNQQKELLQQAAKQSPAEFLYHLKRKKGGFVSSSEKRVLNSLNGQYGLPPDLINILSYTCLTYDSVVSASLAYRIANDWLQHGITNSAQALQYLAERRQTGSRRHFARNSKRVEQGTDWTKKKAKGANEQEMKDLRQFFKNLDNPDKTK